MDREVGQVEGLGRLLWCGVAAPADQELAKAPAHETRVGMESDEAFLRSEREKLRQQRGCLGTEAGERGVDESEDRREGVGSMKLEQPTSHLSAARANREQVEELLVLCRRPIRGQQVLQGGGNEMSVLHTVLL
jgi:hypothetical protein